MCIGFFDIRLFDIRYIIRTALHKANPMKAYYTERMYKIRIYAKTYTAEGIKYDSIQNCHHLFISMTNASGASLRQPSKSDAMSASGRWVGWAIKGYVLAYIYSSKLHLNCEMTTNNKLEYALIY